jgi:hypothetical protein
MQQDLKDEEKGALVYQEGKTLLDVFFVFSVYHHAERAVVTFRAYDLENNETLNIAYSLHEFDQLFKDHVELLNPKSRDARYRWVIERLDIHGEGVGRRLVLNQDPTPESQDLGMGAASKGGPSGPGSSRTMTYAERKRANKEQEKLEQQRAQNIAMKQDRARKQFLTDLHDKRRLESLKAAARVQRIREERAERRVRYEREREAEAEKQTRYREVDAKRKDSLSRLEKGREARSQLAIQKIREQPSERSLEKKKLEKTDQSQTQGASEAKRSRTLDDASRDAKYAKEETERLETLRAMHREERLEKYRVKEEQYLLERKKRILAVRAEEDAKPARKNAFLQQRAAYRAELLRKKYNAQQDWEVLEARRLAAEQRREEIRNEELYNRIEQTRTAEEREKYQHRLQRERTLKERRAKEQEALEAAREAAQIQARLEAKRTEAHEAYAARVREKAAAYCDRIRAEVEEEKQAAAVTDTRLQEARRTDQQAMIEAWREKKDKEMHEADLFQKRKERIALRDLEMSQNEAARAHAANAQAERRAEVIKLAKAAKVESLKSEARVKQEKVTVRRRLRSELDEKREANIAAREAAREEREKARILAEQQAIKAAKDAEKAKKERRSPPAVRQAYPPSQR